MKRHIDLQKAGEAEAFGALAISPRHKRVAKKSVIPPFTPGQRRMLAAIGNSLLRAVRQSGATNKRVAAGGLSFELNRDGREEVLSIRKAA